MRRDRYGEPIDDLSTAEVITTADAEVIEPHRCRRGWIDRDADNPVPCLVCKPHLAKGHEDDDADHALSAYQDPRGGQR